MNNLIGVIEYTRIMIDRYQNKDGVAIDMTLGKGNDTLYLADKFADIVAFDIQQEAIDVSNEKLEGINNVQLIKDSHENFDKYIKDEVDLFIYNLGYLPGFSKDITTKSESTIESLKKALIQLKRKGIVIIVVYVGHQEGYEESKVIEDYLKLIDKEYFTISKYQVMSENAPYVVCINKK